MKMRHHKSPPRTRRTTASKGALVSGCLVAAGAVLTTHAANAQPTDTNPPLPNVLLLLDTSGSMERMIDGSYPEANNASKCVPGTASTANRWGVAMQALTGDIMPYYSCVAQPRTSTPPVAGAYSFNNEYKIGSYLPYDTGFYIDFHRPVSGTSLATACVVAPGGLPGAVTPNGVGPAGLGLGGNPPGAWPGTGTYATDLPPSAFSQRLLTAPGQVPVAPATTTCTFTQLSDGALDTAVATMRFGLMTFDVDPANGTGASLGSTPLVANTPTSPFDGMWSYFPGWDGTGAFNPAQGRPGGCNTLSMFEVGARNPAAPPWEGRFVMLPPANADSITLATNNDNIQKVINASRPYGATPIAGMLSDAQYYFWNDPAGPHAASGPSADPYVTGGCRDQYIILLTDGAPNMDLRTACESGGQCPYTQRPWEITAALANGSTGMKVKTYVIGFAVSSVIDQGVTVQCSSLINNNVLDATCLQNPVPSNYAACCNLQQIALNGHTEAPLRNRPSSSAYFADTPGALNQALSDIFAQISTNTSTRTVPTYSPVVSNPSSGGTPTASTFLSSFNPGVGKPWSGDIQRQQQICTLANGTFSVPAPVVTFANGDDFATNIDSHAGSTPRRFYAVQPGAAGSLVVDAATIIRPYVSTTPLDGLGTYGGVQYGPTVANILANVSATALNVASQPPQCKSLSGNNLTAAQCEALAFNFLFGQQSTPGLATAPPPPAALTPDAQGFLPFKSRYCQAGCTNGNQDRSALGDIFHATPTVVGPPAALVRDESYQQFATANANSNVYGTTKQRRTILYSATNDGLLHAFWADVTQQENNELWAFVPPAVMPSIIGEYPTAHQLLLDGPVVVKDVVYARQAVRSATDLATATTAWHTMLVGSYGSQGRGYYAVDVTNPDPNAQPAGAPQFRWQLTNMGVNASNVANANIFGQHAGTPAIATVYADLSGAGSTTTAQEYGVAVLPGGSETGPIGGPCTRAAAATGNNTSTPLSTFTGRTAVRCWGSTAVASAPVIGRSVAIVRIDTGEIIKVFMRSADLPAGHPLITSGRVINTPLDSPMTGTPSVYPADTGAIAQKIFMSDADGTVWKFDLTDINPNNWTGQMFLDAYNQTVDTDSVNAWSHGQPIAVPLVTSLDRLGSVVLDFATGDQETYTVTGTNFIYSVSEKVQGSSTFSLRAQVNWYQKLVNGERVSGPMSVFDGVLYLATFRPTASAGCSVGSPFIWGMDYVTPADTNDLSKAGLARLVNAGSTYQVIDPTGGNVLSPLAGHVIPGISIQAQPACASSSTGADSYVPGSTHTTTSNVTPGGYQLFAQVGAKGLSGNASVGTYKLDLPPPQTATVIDSWAAVVE